MNTTQRDMEQTFLRDCLAHHLCPDRPLPTPPPDLNWDRVYDLLIRHRLTGLFYTLGSEHPGLWPQGLQERLQSVRYRALLRGDRCVEHIGMVLTALRQAGISVIVLKGWALIPVIYEGDYSQRTYDDIDLLVLPRDAAHTEGILHDLGYMGEPDEPWPGYFRRYRNSRAYQLPDEPAYFAVGLHWGLLDTPFYDRWMVVKDLFERAQPLQLAGVDVYGLAEEDHVIYTCGHLALHHEYDEALFRYYEVASLIRQAEPAFDWNTIMTRTCIWRLIIPVQRVLLHIESLWPGIVSAQALEEVSALQPTLAERIVHRWVVEEKDNPVIRAALAWLTMPGLGRRWRFLLETIFPGPAYMRRRYGPAPGGFWPLLYLRRAAATMGHVIPRTGEQAEWRESGH